MTSSLVGSEMCIRDRPSLAFAATGFASSGGFSPVHSGSGALFSVTAVSYTHLTLPTICSV
eukprot:6670403-Prorocentrum_lima.AAC.1